MEREQIAEALQALGLQTSHIVFVHSSLSSVGFVEGGADAVVDAFLDVLGSTGTLVVPTFTFSHGGAPNPVFDPIRDPSEMGRITEVTRTRPGAQRSCHLLHSVAASGTPRGRYRRCPWTLRLGSRWSLLETLRTGRTHLNARCSLSPLYLLSCYRAACAGALPAVAGSRSESSRAGWARRTTPHVRLQSQAGVCG